jgi:hypothetical protein
VIGASAPVDYFIDSEGKIRGIVYRDMEGRKVMVVVIDNFSIRENPDIPEFKEKAIEIAKAGIYDLRIHHDEVVLPVLFKQKIDKVTGLSDEAEQARDGITNYLSMLDAMAAHYEEKRAARESG